METHKCRIKAEIELLLIYVPFKLNWPQLSKHSQIKGYPYKTDAKWKLLMVIFDNFKVVFYRL